MKKILINSAMALCILGNIVAAEESGVFIGFGAGYGAEQLKTEGGSTLNGGGEKVDIVAGYKRLFTRSFGLRYYANLDYTSGELKQNGQKTKLDAINYGVNLDLLYNFINSGSISFGMFAGVGLGANTWNGKSIKELKQSGTKVSTTGFDTAFNIGVRGGGKFHGFELIARGPFVGTKDGVPFVGTPLTKGEGKVTAYTPYSVGVRYTLTF